MPIETVHRTSNSPYVARVWQGRVVDAARMTSVASSTWELVFWHDGGVPHATVRGPETTASTVPVTGDAESFGITFAHGATLLPLPAAELVDREWQSPRTSERRFALAGEEWEIPGPDDAELLVDRLVRAGVLVRDPMVGDVIWGGVARVGTRSVQRRVAATTGLSQGAIRQIDRARRAALLLREGVAVADVVHRCGYYDQPHLARSLRRFIGRTAGDIQRDDTGDPLSLLYKPDSPDGA